MIDDNQRLKVRSWRAPAINHTSKEALAVTTEPNSRNRRPQSNDADFVGRLRVVDDASHSNKKPRNHAARGRHRHYIAESLSSISSRTEPAAVLLSLETLAAIS
ncbi:hypothetical protein CH63R_01859 [Colletotrichum higginsianum IMI 349063]|uniref:Uncharacterized protein n=1 Tax=Colletotrichum higginsianum (strain IMI 349063) TaxID=759273 RepID=A0A1B7YM55_COLHI|nr:hypothetical protein CH63R_01859 [Colletotrichum higginsianum IMI 349063]OBR13133.1 hypothetical protein CH63R_01859 [Colletotrichum higginsianum IMI 349063]